MLRDHLDTPTSSPAPVEALPDTGPAKRTPTHRRSPRRPSFFVQEAFEDPGTSGLRVGVIADGTTRGGPNGIAEGARRVVEHAEHCARRGDIALLAVFILSPSNVARRKRRFFAALHAEFLRLLEGIVSGRHLVGIRVEVHGRRGRLRGKGGAAARLSYVLDLLAEVTVAVTAPRFRLVLCVDYEEDAPITLGLDLLLRTGMEEPSVLRLSGLRVRQTTICIPSETLWRDFTPGDLDRALARRLPGPERERAVGFSSGFVAELLTELSSAGLPTPCRVTLPLSAPSETLSMLESGGGSAWRQSGHVAVTTSLAPGARERRFGPRGAPVQVVLTVPGGPLWSARDEPAAWIAPGQSSPVFHLLDRSVGDANVHACEPTPDGIVDGLRRALRFHAAYPPLHGAPRPAAPAATPVTAPQTPPQNRAREQALPHRAREQADATPSPERPALTPDRAPVADAFAATCLSEARAAGLMSGEVDWSRQALGYALTAFLIALRRPPAAAPVTFDQGPAARDLARVMLALAAADEEITDRVFPSETPRARRARLAVSIDHLVAAVRGGPRSTGSPPPVLGAASLQAVARTWEAFFARHATSAHPDILAAVRRTAEDLLRANLDELSSRDPLFAALSSRPSSRASAAALARLAASAPAPVERRIRELAEIVWRVSEGAEIEGTKPPLVSRAAPEGVADVWRELRLLCRLVRVAPSIGAGCALLAMAATEPSRAVPAEGAAALLRITPLIDHYFRLANDLAFEDATRGDRDDKPGLLTCLIPATLTGKAREQATISALRTCRATAAWLDGEIRTALAELSRCWPLAALWLRRGTLVGRRAYELGHYDRLGPGAWASIAAEIERIEVAC